MEDRPKTTLEPIQDQKHQAKDASIRTHTEDPEVTNKFAEKAQSVYHSIKIETKDTPQPAVKNSVQFK